MDAKTTDAMTDAMSDAMRTTDGRGACSSVRGVSSATRSNDACERTTDDDDDDRGYRFLRVTNGSFVISRARFTAG